MKTLQDQNDLLLQEIDTVRKENVEKTAELTSRDNSIRSLRQQLDSTERLLRTAEISSEMLNKASDDMVCVMQLDYSRTKRFMLDTRTSSGWFHKET